MRLSTSLLHGVLLGAVAFQMQAVQAQAPLPGVYTCIDAKGRKLTSDRPIPECVDREQKVLNPSGTVKAKVGPTLTAQERAAAEAKEKETAEARALAQDERRRERALLTRYPSSAVHDKERAEALAQIAVVVQTANTRIEELQRDRRKLDQELEFYKKDPSKAPPSLRRQVEDLEQSMVAQKRFIGEQDVEVRRVNVRFDEELARLKPLWSGQAQAQAQGLAKPASAPATARKTP